MRIGLLSSLPVTLDTFFPSWVDRWRAEGHHVAPASGPGADGSASSIVGAVAIRGITRDPSPVNGTAHRRLRAWVRAERLDVVLTNTATASAIVRTARTGVPVVYFCHGLHVTGHPRVRDRVFLAAERALLRATAGVVVLSADDERWFRARVAAGTPVERLDAGVGLDLAHFAATSVPATDDGLRLVWIGELVRNKRPLDALAVARLRGLGVDATLTMLGDGPLLEQVRAAAPAYVDVVGRQDPVPAITAAHALLHTSEREGLPRVQLEAAAVGRPSFGYDIRGVRDAPGVTAVGVVGDTGALATALERWWRAGAPAPVLDRDRLDWRRAHDRVTALLATVTRA
jgi:glycosyltransferase involved in cell wall biosynthesis